MTGLLILLFGKGCHAQNLAGADVLAYSGADSTWFYSTRAQHPNTVIRAIYGHQERVSPKGIIISQGYAPPACVLVYDDGVVSVSLGEKQFLFSSFTREFPEGGGQLGWQSLSGHVSIGYRYETRTLIIVTLDTNNTLETGYTIYEYQVDTRCLEERVLPIRFEVLPPEKE